MCSRAHLALLKRLARYPGIRRGWTGCFGGRGYTGPKWERRDYRESMIAMALSGRVAEPGGGRHW